MTFADSKQRFSTRAADYLRYRPRYPSGVRDILRAECGLKSGHSIADIGSGTGLLSELFLKNGNRVFGVEPNEAMRQAGEEYLASYDSFMSVDGSAEATTLEDACVDFVTAGQSFHWFDQNAARREFVRILKPGGWVVVIWNERLTNTTPFLRDYEALLYKFGTDYAQVKESYPSEQHMLDFFGANAYSSHALPNSQDFDFEGLA
ncbi:MAG: class I SAM-dependent methyltransferase, partial [Chthoniobacterales bacterium]